MAKDLQVSQPLEAREDWIEDELAGCEFADVRHGKRLGKLLEQISFGQGSRMPWAFQDWANTKAAYRFFANGRVDEATILGGHFKAIRARFESVRDAGPVLVLHNTTTTCAEARWWVSYAKAHNEGPRIACSPTRVLAK